MITQLFDQLFFIPLFNLLVFFYNTIAFQDFGIAIIILTLLIRLFLSPLSLKALKSQKELAILQPKIKEIQSEYKNDKQAQTQAMLALYKEHKVNPLSGCFPLLIQFPFLIALYRVSINGFNPKSLSFIYSFVSNPGQLHTLSLGIIDLTQRSVALAITAGAFQFIQSRLALKLQKSQPQSSARGGQSNMMSMMGKQMAYMFPLITVFISLSFPAGLPLYWIASTVFSIFEHLAIQRITPKTALAEPDAQ